MKWFAYIDIYKSPMFDKISQNIITSMPKDTLRKSLKRNLVRHIFERALEAPRFYLRSRVEMISTPKRPRLSAQKYV